MMFFDHLDVVQVLCACDDLQNPECLGLSWGPLLRKLVVVYVWTSSSLKTGHRSSCLPRHFHLQSE